VGADRQPPVGGHDPDDDAAVLEAEGEGGAGPHRSEIRRPAGRGDPMADRLAVAGEDEGEEGRLRRVGRHRGRGGAATVGGEHRAGPSVRQHAAGGPPSPVAEPVGVGEEQPGSRHVLHRVALAEAFGLGRRGPPGGARDPAVVDPGDGPGAVPRVGDDGGDRRALPRRAEVAGRLGRQARRGLEVDDGGPLRVTEAHAQAVRVRRGSRQRASCRVRRPTGRRS
jgi:hypothetical protein